MLPCTDVQRKVSPVIFNISKWDMIIVCGLDCDVHHFFIHAPQFIPSYLGININSTKDTAILSMHLDSILASQFYPFSKNR